MSDTRTSRIPTGKLNCFVAESLENPRASTPSQRPVKVLYLTQARSAAPTFVLFTNNVKGLRYSHERHVINRPREDFDFFAAPIRNVQRTKSS